MQRILSVEASRSSGLSSEFVTKRLCCSFILTVAFFAVIGGFLLGRFVADKTTYKMKLDLTEISKKLTTLDQNIKVAFHSSAEYSNCTALSSHVKCEHLRISSDETSSSNRSVKEILDILNNCFNNG